MKKIIVTGLLIFLLVLSVFMLSGCTLQIETTDNSVSASVDGDTTEKVDNIIDWIKARLNKLFKTDNQSSTSDSSENSETA